MKKKLSLFLSNFRFVSSIKYKYYGASILLSMSRETEYLYAHMISAKPWMRNTLISTYIYV